MPEEDRSVKWHIAMIYLYASELMEMGPDVQGSAVCSTMKKIKIMVDGGISAYERDHPPPPAIEVEP